VFFVLDSLLNPAQLAQLRNALVPEAFSDSSHSAQGLARQVKHNLQVAPTHPVASQCTAVVLGAIHANAAFRNFAVPVRITTPIFNWHAQGMHYGPHTDSALMDAGGMPMRSDYSMTIFLSNPTEYEGGELSFTSSDNLPVNAKLDAGHAVLYPSNTLHEVRPVTQGVRLACVLWVQSAIAQQPQRNLLHELDRVRSALDAGQPDEARQRLVLVKENMTRLFASP
jgi:PKHD-type hydroxylase